MKLVYFSSKQNDNDRQKLVLSIGCALPGLDIEKFSDVKSLHSWLQVPPRKFFAAILEPHDCKTMIDLIELSEYFSNRKVILLIPDSSPQAFTYASRLTPNSILSKEDGNGAIVSVLTKWIHIRHAEKREWL